MRKLYYATRDFVKQMSKQNISAFSANTAFFIFLSLIPMLIMMCTIIPYTPLSEMSLVNAITEITPDAFNPLLVSVISQVYDKSAGILSVAAVATIWSAGKGVLALIRGLNAVNGVEEERNYFVVRTVASIYTVIVMIMLILLLIMSVFGNVIVIVIEKYIPNISLLFDVLFKLRFILVWTVLTFFLTLIYAYLPARKRKLFYQIPGAAVSAILWSGFSWIFSAYVDSYDGVTAYGTLSIIILIMLWLYFGIYIVMVGAYLNRYFFPTYHVIYKRRKMRAREKRLANTRRHYGKIDR